MDANEIAGVEGAGKVAPEHVEADKGAGGAVDKGAGQETKGPKTDLVASLRAEIETLRKAEQARKEAAQKAAQQEAEKRGEFKRLYDEAKSQLESVENEYNALKAAESARVKALEAHNAARIEALPGDWAALIPDGLTPDKVKEQIDRIERLAKVESTKAAGTVAGSYSADVVPDIPPECVRDARSMGMDPKVWYPHWLKLNNQKHVN